MMTRKSWPLLMALVLGMSLVWLLTEDQSSRMGEVSVLTFADGEHDVSETVRPKQTGLLLPRRVQPVRLIADPILQPDAVGLAPDVVKSEGTATIRGFVRDDRGTSISSANVIIQKRQEPVPANEELAAFLPAGEDRAREDGSYAVTGLALGTYRVLVEPDDLPQGILKPKHRDALAEVSISNEGETVWADVVLTRGATVEGRVLGPDGAGVVGARLTVWFSDYGGHGLAAHPVSQRDGYWRADGVHPGSGRVSVSLPSDPTLSELVRPAPIRFEVPAGGSQWIDIRYERGTTTVRGRVIDQMGGPFPGVEVACWEKAPAGTGPLVGDGDLRLPWRRYLRGERTDSTGSYELKHLPSSEIIVAFYSEEWSERPSYQEEEVFVTGPRGPVLELDLRSAPARVDAEDVTLSRRSVFKLNGTVHWDHSGKLAIGGGFHARLTIAPLSTPQEAEEPLDFHNGRFHWECEAPAQPMVLRVYSKHTGAVIMQRLITPRSYETEAIDIRLPNIRP